jgi:uncharacterized protein (DUF433 family)
MTITLEPRIEPVPIETDAGGNVRVGGTRVTLDTVIGAFKDGETPEEIALQYPVLRLADIYAVIAYYLREQEAVEAYLQARAQQREAIKRDAEARFNAVGIRERLQARLRKP